MNASFGQRLSENFGSLSGKLKEAGKYVADHPMDVATRSLRTVAQESGLAPATYSRLAKALQYGSFEEIREAMRETIGRRANSFADRAEHLQTTYGDGETTFAKQHLAASRDNLNLLESDFDFDRLEDAATALHGANRVMVFGALASRGIAEYMCYLANYYTDNWCLFGRSGSSFGAGLVDLNTDDALIVITKPPFATKALHAAQVARKQGVFVIVISDTPLCPALGQASLGFVVPTDSSHFFSSYVTTVYLVEALIGMLASRAGTAAKERITQVENRTRLLEETWVG